MSLTIGSLFSGIGGLLDLGLERAGMTVAWQCEADERCRQLLAKRFPGAPCYDDVRTVQDAPAVNVLCGGFPCQDISVAGRRAGLAGERSGLFHEFACLADSLAPTWVLIENVPGLLSSNGGRDMGTVLGVLADLGYGWAYRVLDAQYFGVAQRRRRVFIVGCLGDAARAAAVLLEPEICEGNPAPSREAGQGVAGTLGSSPAGSGWRGDTDRMTFVPVVGQLGGAHNGNRNDPSRQSFVAETLRSHPRPGSATTGPIVPVLAFAHQAGDNRTASGAFMDDCSVTTGGGKPGQGYPAVRQGMAVRRLTPLECERLQGFPDGWTEGFPDSVRYRMLGNAVAVPCAEWIGRRMVAADALRQGLPKHRSKPTRAGTGGPSAPPVSAARSSPPCPEPSARPHRGPHPALD
jgi:DNA (cytosine-5)-methyltransferase 1